MELAFRARLPGRTHLQLHELNSPLTRTPESPVGALPQNLGLPRRSPGSTAPLRADLRTKFRCQPADSDPESPTWTRRRPCTLGVGTPPRADPPDVSLAKLRTRQPRRHRIGPRGSHYNQTKECPVPAAPLWIERRPCPLTRIRATIDNPLIRSPERTSGSAGAPSQVPMCITRYLRAQDTGGYPP